jgi:hypothetical protein
METHFNLHFHENWSEEDVSDAIAIVQRVDGYFRRE